MKFYINLFLGVSVFLFTNIILNAQIENPCLSIRLVAPEFDISLNENGDVNILFNGCDKCALGQAGYDICKCRINCNDLSNKDECLKKCGDLPQPLKKVKGHRFTINFWYSLEVLEEIPQMEVPNLTLDSGNKSGELDMCTTVEANSPIQNPKSVCIEIRIINLYDDDTCCTSVLRKCFKL